MRVLAINDISCVGKCSLSVSVPIISACGVTCDVLPTALLSTHTGGFENYTFRDLTSDIPDILKHWKSLGITFDCIYSGYLGSIEQIELVAQIKREFLSENGLFIVDPVMGDSGELYAGFTQAFVDKMRELCKQANYILPNVTEACYLSGVPYPDECQSYPTATVLERLKTLCARPIVTGIHNGRNILVSYIGENGEQKEFSAENVPGFFCGAGDVFASAFVGALMRGKNQDDAVLLASKFVTNAIVRSATEVEDKRYGLNYEKEIFAFLKDLNG